MAPSAASAKEGIPVQLSVALEPDWTAGRHPTADQIVADGLPWQYMRRRLRAIALAKAGITLSVEPPLWHLRLPH